MKPNKTQLVVILTFAGFASTARAQWTVYDPAVHTQQIIGTAQEIAAILRDEGVAGMPLGVDVIEMPMLRELEAAGITVTDAEVDTALREEVANGQGLVTESQAVATAEANANATATAALFTPTAVPTVDVNAVVTATATATETPAVAPPPVVITMSTGSGTLTLHCRWAWVHAARCAR